MAAWVREEEKASENRQMKKEAEKVHKIKITPEVTVPSLRHFRVALIGPTQGLTKRPRLHPLRSLKTVRIRCCRCNVFGDKCEVVPIRRGIEWLVKRVAQ